MSSPESASSSSDRYSGIWKVRWLIRQAQNSPSSEIRQEALSKALNLIQHEWIDSQLLENVCAQFSIPLDRQLTRKKNIAFFEQQKRLTEELDLRKRALRKEKIRSSLHELAQLLYRRGLFEKAANKYLEAKKNAINEEEKMESIWCAIEAAVAADSFGHIIPICNQILTQKDARIPNDMFSRFHAILALKDFKQGNLSQACQHFLKAAQNLQTDANLAQIFSFPFATAQDIGMYTGFLCMCSLSRSDLGSIALRNRVVRSLIEQSPQTFNCCQKFYDGKYAEALDMIRKIGSEVLSVDWFACKVISKVQDCIRTEMFYLYTK